VSDPGTLPPSFEDARNRRQKVRAAGLDPDYWYAVEWDRAVRPGQVVATKFWKTPIALFRAHDGTLSAVLDRCAHRQLALSVGHVEDGCLVCPYHGWTYDGSGTVVRMPHDLFGREMPHVRVPSFPVKVRYGLIWIFPGDPAEAERRRIPDIPELEGPDRWACAPLDFTWRAHHSMIIDNVSDFTHAYLHRDFRPFVDAKLTRHALEGDRVTLAYDAKIGRGRISGLFVDRSRANTDSIELAYEYPYQWSNTGGTIKHWCFVLPIDERTTRAFFLFYFDAFVVPFTRLRFPRRVMQVFLRIGSRMAIRPLLAQDGFAVEGEQRGYDEHFDAPIIELNPAVHLFQKLTVRKWEEHLARAATRPRPAAAPAPACEPSGTAE
jgi:phenylpropionate dioxygenase-like ring-hydroxylating dioxygenase large terminal subunit